MNCKEIRELLLSDYTDGEAKPSIRNDVETHLARCRQCREFKEALLKETVEPFKKEREAKPPDYLWYRIQDKIQAQDQEQPNGLFIYLRDILKTITHIPKPAIALAAVVVIVTTFTISKVMYERRLQVADYLNEQIQIMASLSNGDSTSSESGFGTALEEYLL